MGPEQAVNQALWSPHIASPGRPSVIDGLILKAIGRTGRRMARNRASV